MIATATSTLTPCSLLWVPELLSITFYVVEKYVVLKVMFKSTIAAFELASQQAPV
jgi:hypothetical protein